MVREHEQSAPEGRHALGSLCKADRDGVIQLVPVVQTGWIVGGAGKNSVPQSYFRLNHPVDARSCADYAP